MNKLKQWVALTMVAVLGLFALGWFLLISPKRSDAAKLDAQAAAQESTNRGLETTLASLKAQQKGLVAQQAKIAAVAAKIPDNTAQASLVRQLQRAADDADVELNSISPGTPGAGPAGTSLQASAYGLIVYGGYFQIESFLAKLENLTRAAKVTNLAVIPASDPLTPAANSSSTGVAKGTALQATISATVYNTTAAPATTGTAAAAAPTTPTTPTTTTAR